MKHTPQAGGSYVSLLRRRFRGKFVLANSNLLLLLLVGTFEPGLVRSFKRLSAFGPVDRLLQEFVKGYRVATSPHVLTEVSNLAKSLPEPVKTRLFPYLASRVSLMTEVHLSAESLVRLPEFVLFGLNDAALRVLAETHLLLTHDERLANHLRSARGLPVLTLWDIRAAIRS